MSAEGIVFSMQARQAEVMAVQSGDTEPIPPTSLQCRLVHAIPGRVRIRMETPQLFNGLAEAFQAFLGDRPGIQEIKLNPGCQSVTLAYDPDMLKVEDLLALLQALSPDQLRAYLQCRLVHAIRGRVRVRVEAPQLFEDLAEAFQAFLSDQPGIQEVRLSPSCRSVTLTYDPDMLKAEDLLALLQTLSPDQLKAYQPRRAHHQAPDSDSISWLPLGLSSTAIALDVVAESVLAPWLLLGAAVPIFIRAFESLTQKGKLNVDTLDAAATTVLALQGQIQTASVMVWLVSLGDFIRDITMQRSRQAIESLFDGKTQLAWVVRDGKKIQVKVAEIQEQDEVVVYPGELIPVDGIVLMGKATVDQKVLTGESMPVEKGVGEQVYAATVLREGKLYLRATKVGEETMAGKVVQLVRDAPIRETRIQNYAEQFADRLVPWSFLGAGISAVVTGGVNGAASLLIVDYGTGIRVAAPTTVLSAMTKAAYQGILIKGGRYLEQLAEVDAIVFDKTGTLTLGTPEVVEVIPYGKNGKTVSGERILALAAAAEARLTHPVAEAIVRAAKIRGIAIPERETSEYSIGLGIEAVVGDASVLVGSHRFMAQKGVPLRRARKDMLATNGRAASPLFVAVDGRLIGLIVYTDPLRPEAAGAVQALRERGVKEIVMLTGDHPAVAEQVAKKLGISRYIADAFPEQKSAFVKALQQQGHTVAVVGDGINDSPALAQADVGIAVRGGVDVARETAHVALLEGNLWQIPRAIDIAREAVHLIEQNWTLIVYPNTAAILLSLPGLIGPVGATLISNGSALLATLNALRPLFAIRRRSLEQRDDQPLQSELRGGANDSLHQLVT